jgi:hypothetical protein
MSYVNIPKPSNSTYTKVKNGFTQYDDVTVAFDDPNIFYDGATSSGYVNISKPVSSVYTKVNKPT